MAVLNDEQIMLRDMAREWTQNESPVTEWRKVRSGGDERAFDPAAYQTMAEMGWTGVIIPCLLYTSPSPRDKRQSRMPSSA